MHIARAAREIAAAEQNIAQLQRHFASRNDPFSRGKHAFVETTPQFDAERGDYHSHFGQIGAPRRCFVDRRSRFRSPIGPLTRSIAAFHMLCGHFDESVAAFRQSDAQLPRRAHDFASRAVISTKSHVISVVGHSPLLASASRVSASHSPPTLSHLPPTLGHFGLRFGLPGSPGVQPTTPHHRPLVLTCNSYLLRAQASDFAPLSIAVCVAGSMAIGLSSMKS